MFHMTVEGRFSAAHAIREYPGACQYLHGHNYRVVVYLAGAELDRLGLLIDYTDVKRALEVVLAPYDHAYLNELPYFTAHNPTSEEIARVLYRELHAALFVTPDLQRRVRLVRVDVFESENQGVGYGED